MVNVFVGGMMDVDRNATNIVVRTPYEPSFHKPSSLWALILSGVLATCVFVSFPIFATVLGEKSQAATSQFGWFASAELSGNVLVCLTGMYWLGLFDWHKLLFGALGLMAIFNLVSIPIDDLNVLLLARFFCGVGGGIVVVIVFTSLCHASNPDRAFGWYVVLQLTLQLILLVSFPHLIEQIGNMAIFICYAGFAVFCMFLVKFLPKGLPTQNNISQQRGNEHTKLSTPARIGLLAQGIYFLAPAALWAYFEPIGKTFALDTATISQILGMTALAGLLGAGMVVLLGRRLNRIFFMSIGVVISVCAVLIAYNGQGYFQFLLVGCLFNFGWNFTFPYQMGVLAKYDRKGEIGALSLLVQTLGLAIGPMMASMLFTDSGFHKVLTGVLICYTLSYIMFYCVSKDV